MREQEIQPSDNAFTPETQKNIQFLLDQAESQSRKGGHKTPERPEFSSIIAGPYWDKASWDGFRKRTIDALTNCGLDEETAARRFDEVTTAVKFFADKP